MAINSAAVVTFTAAGAGAPFTLACSLEPANAGTYSAGTPAPAVVHGHDLRHHRRPGDVLVTTINSVPVSYTAGPADTTRQQLATSIAATINAAVAAGSGDPASR